MGRSGYSVGDYFLGEGKRGVRKRAGIGVLGEVKERREQKKLVGATYHQCLFSRRCLIE